MAIDIFLKIDGVRGESRDKAHVDEIVVNSYSFGVTGGSINTRDGPGKVTMSDVRFTHQIDTASPALFLASASGRHFKSAQFTLRVRDARGSRPIAGCTISDAVVTLVQQGVSQDQTVEEVALSFKAIQVTNGLPPAAVATPTTTTSQKTAVQPSTTTTTTTAAPAKLEDVGPAQKKVTLTNPTFRLRRRFRRDVEDRPFDP